MIYILDAIYVFLSVLFMIGRLFEIINFTDLQTGYLNFNGIVSNPIIVLLLFVIAFCCAMIIFPFKEEQHPRMKFKIGMLGFVAAVFFMSGALINIIWIFRVGGFLGFDIFVILGSLALIFFSMADIKARKIEKIPFLLVLLIPSSFCLRSMLFNVYSISNTIATQRNISFVLTFAFFILVFKNAYAPTRHSDTALYAVSLANFTFSTAGLLALELGQTIKVGVQWNDIFSDLAFITIGVLSLVTAVNLNKKSEMFNYEPEDDEKIKSLKDDIPVKEIKVKKINEKPVESKKVVYKADK